MRFEDLQICPFCGFDVFHEKQQVRGTIAYRMYFDKRERYEADNTEIYNSLHIFHSGRAYCDNCEHYLGNYITGVVGKDALRKFKENDTDG